MYQILNSATVSERNTLVTEAIWKCSDTLFVFYFIISSLKLFLRSRKSLSFSNAVNRTRSKDAASNKFPNNTVATATTNKPTQASKTNANQQLNLRLTPELALERIERVMQRASAEIESIVRQLKSIDTSKTD